MSCSNAAVKPSAVYCASRVVFDGVDVIKLLAAPVPGPTRRFRCPTTAASALSPICAANCWAAARVSHDMRCHAPLTLLHDHQDAAHITRTSNRSFSTSLAAASLAVPSINWVCLVRSRQVDALDGRGGRRGHAQFGRSEPLHLFVLRLLDAHQRGVAQLVDAGLNGQHARAAASRRSGTSRLPARASRGCRRRSSRPA